MKTNQVLTFSGISAREPFYNIRRR